ncbi:MAG: response regulator transcription factor [Verrucomicrobiales bacterium]|jgi:two-component system copper resistance phosphate regulon response regulator CusR/two-component system response regulator QseB|nr:response regulator transcription factor [Verrucomicrobiales bacterium]
MKILIVEDDKKVGQFLQRNLSQAAYSCTWVETSAKAFDQLTEQPYDVVILDLTLPDQDGLEFLRQCREAGFREPVLILSARDAVQDRIKGLNLGADDYLPKPFSFEELLARIRALLRREASQKGTVYEHLGIRLDLVARTVTHHGKPVDLTAREFALLELFMLNHGRVLTRNLIMEKIWESTYDLDPNLLDVYMRRMRLKFEQPDGSPVFKTLRGIGYQMP